MSFRDGAGTTSAVVVLFFLVELFGEVQDERDETVGVWFIPHARRRRDATTGIGGAGEGHGGEVHTPAPQSPHHSWSECPQVSPSIRLSPTLFGWHFLACSVEPVGELVAAVEGGVESLDLLIGQFGRELVEVVAFPPVRQFAPGEHERPRRKGPSLRRIEMGFSADKVKSPCVVWWPENVWVLVGEEGAIM